jgi:AcrR family transcriptional regulator
MNDGHGANAQAERILDTALRLGEQRGWDAVHLHDVAQCAGLSLAQLRRHFRQKDDLAEAWFDRADSALLRAGDGAQWQSLAARERLLHTILAWFDALAPHRALSVEMLRYKLQPDHLHLHVHGLLRISRTVQWIRETARLPAVGWRREFEEAALTGLFLGTVGCWQLDRSPDARRTRAWLDQRLKAAERAAFFLFQR